MLLEVCLKLNGVPLNITLLLQHWCFTVDRPCLFEHIPSFSMRDCCLAELLNLQGLKGFFDCFLATNYTWYQWHTIPCSHLFLPKYRTVLNTDYFDIFQFSESVSSAGMNNDLLLPPSMEKSGSLTVVLCVQRMFLSSTDLR